MCRWIVAQVLEPVENEPRRVVPFPSPQSLGSRRQFEGRFQALASRTFDAAFECPVHDGTSDLLKALIQAIRPLVGLSQHYDDHLFSWEYLVHPDDHEVVTAHIQRVLSGKRDICVFRVTTTHGDIRWMSALTRPVRECVNQDVSYVYGLVKDYMAGFGTSSSSEEEEATSTPFHRFVCPAPHQEDDAGTYAPA